MSARHVPILLLVALLLWMGAELALVWPSLPPRIATHFNAAGHPNGWSTPGQLVLSMASLFAIFGALFVAAGWLEWLPDALVNIPNKDYWFAPERRAASFAAVRDWLRWGLLAPLAFLVFDLTATLDANLGPRPHLQMNVWWLGGMLAFTAVMIAWPFWRFHTPRTH